MATRFRLPASGAAAVSPALQSYTHSTADRVAMPTAAVGDASVLANITLTPDAADHLVAGDTFFRQFVSAQMAAGNVFTSGDAIKMVVQGFEANASNECFLQVWVGVYSSDGSTLRATLRSKSADNTEYATTPAIARLHSTTLSGSYTTVADDRLVVEFSLVGTPVAAGGTQGHNGVLRFGSNGSSGDALENDTSTSVLINPWIEVLTTITFSGGGGSALTADINDTLAIADALALTVQVVVADTLAIADARALTESKVIADTLSIADGVTTLVGRTAQVDDTLAIADAVVVDFQKVVPDTLAIADAVVVDFQKVIADPLAIADAQALTVQMVVTDPLAIADSVLAETGKEALVDDTLAIADSVTTLVERNALIADGLAIADALALAVQMNVADTLAIVDAITAARGLFVLIEDTMGTGGTVTVIDAPKLVLVDGRLALRIGTRFYTRL